MLFDLGLDDRRVKSPNRHDRHVAGPIPAAVEIDQALDRSVFDDLGQTDRRALGVERVAEYEREQIVLQARTESLAEPPFLQDHAALKVHFLGVEGDCVGPVAQDLECGLDDFGIVGRDLDPVEGAVKTGLGVDVGPERAADRFKVLNDLLPGETLGAIEGHVLDEVRQSALVVFFQQRAGLDHQRDLGAVAGLGVLPDVVAQAVGQGSANDFGVKRQRRTGFGFWVRFGFGSRGRRGLGLGFGRFFVGCRIDGFGRLRGGRRRGSGRRRRGSGGRWFFGLTQIAGDQPGQDEGEQQPRQDTPHTSTGPLEFKIAVCSYWLLRNLGRSDHRLAATAVDPPISNRSGPCRPFPRPVRLACCARRSVAAVRCRWC